MASFKLYSPVPPAASELPPDVLQRLLSRQGSSHVEVAIVGPTSDEFFAAHTLFPQSDTTYVLTGGAVTPSQLTRLRAYLAAQAVGNVQPEPLAVAMPPMWNRDP